MKIIVRVRELRKHRNLTQEELARQLKISRQSLISLEQGRWLPSLPLAVQLAEFFNAPLEQVVCALPNQIANDTSLPTDNKQKEVTMPRDLNPWPPIRELRDMRDEIDRIFDSGLPIATPTMVMPTINIRHDDNNVYVEAHVPGFSQDDIDIDVADDMITITGSIKEEKEDGKEAGYIRREYNQQSFTRTVGLPVTVNSDAAEAKLSHGILTITLPKMQEEKPKTKRLKPSA